MTNKQLIKEFSQLMLKEMDANEHKDVRGPWIKVHPKELLADVLYHCGKLAVSIRECDDEGVREYSADVANLAMMVLKAFEGQELSQPQGRYDLSPCGDS